jgi:hypothetical protein
MTRRDSPTTKTLAEMLELAKQELKEAEELMRPTQHEGESLVVRLPLPRAALQHFASNGSVSRSPLGPGRLGANETVSCL